MKKPKKRSNLDIRKAVPYHRCSADGILDAGGLAYASSKAGVNGLTYAWARELSGEGITVNAIAPGFIQDTGFTGGWSDEIVGSIVSQIPVKRAGNVSDVAGLALFLASPGASYITGEVLNINGGWLFGR